MILISKNIKLIIILLAFSMTSELQASYLDEYASKMVVVLREKVFDPLNYALRKTNALFQRFIFENKLAQLARKAIDDDEDMKVFVEANNDFSAGNFEQSEHKISMLIDKYPDKEILYLFRSIIQAEMGDIKQAMKTLAIALDKNPDFSEALVWKSQLYLAMGDLDKARDTSASIGEKYKDIPAMLFINALVKWKKKQYDEAINGLENLLQLYPEQISVNEYLSVMYHEQGRLQQAYDAIDVFILSHPKKHLEEANYYKIEILIDMWAIKRARAIYDTEFGGDSKSWYGLNVGIDIAHAEHDTEQVIILAEKLVEYFPNSNLADFVLFRAYLADRDYIKAKSIVARIQKKHPNSGAVYGCKGDILLSQDRYSDAIIQYKYAIKIDPDNKLYYQNIGWSYSEIEKYSDAIQWYKQALKKFPDDYQLNKQAGRIYRFLGNSKDAIAAYNKAIAVHAAGAGAYMGLGNTYKESGELDSAEKSYLRAIEISPFADEPYWLLAVIYLDKKQYDKAISYARQAIQRSPGKGPAYAVLAQTYFAKGKKDSAREICYQMSKKIRHNKEGYLNSSHKCMTS